MDLYVRGERSFVSLQAMVVTVDPEVEARARALFAHIQMYGLLQAVDVLPDGQGRFVVLHGRARVEALRMLGAKYAAVKVWQGAVEDVEALRRQARAVPGW